MRKCFIGLLLGASLAFGAALSVAQSYPNKQIRFIVPYPPGGGTDIVARAIAAKMQESMGQPIVIDNRSGASEMIGTEALVRSAADGYTIGMVTNSIAINPAIQPRVAYDAARDLVAVSNIVNVPFMLVVHPAAPYSTVREFVAAAKAQPGKLNYASLGSGSPHSLAMEWLKTLAGIDVVAISYKGVAPAITALSAGEVPVGFSGLTAAMAQVRAGKLKAIAVTPAQRVSIMPDIPTIAESGYPEFDLMTWYGVMVPTGSPPEIIAKLNAEIAKALAAPDIKQRFAGIGIEAAPTSAAEFATRIRNELQLWARIVKLTGAKAE
ncbi:MAG: tripartite tricarboxylate transporter substrate binding protein [Burkholderiales bacterium]